MDADYRTSDGIDGSSLRRGRPLEVSRVLLGRKRSLVQLEKWEHGRFRLFCDRERPEKALVLHHQDVCQHRHQYFQHFARLDRRGVPECETFGRWEYRPITCVQKYGSLPQTAITYNSR